MPYTRLPFTEYFINTSEDYTHTGRTTYRVDYVPVYYRSGLLKLKHEVNYEVHYEPDRNVIQLNFQCTNGFMDWVANIFEFSSKYYRAINFEGEPLQLRVHHGWGDMYLAVKREVREHWLALYNQHPDAATEILGWSLGAGIACLCCQDLNYNFGIKPYLYTFGSVRPFKYLLTNKERTKRYLSTIYTDCRNFADVNDLITYLPPFRGFTMINRVDVGTDEKKSFFKMLQPLKFHTHYYRDDLYCKNKGDKNTEKTE